MKFVNPSFKNLYNTLRDNKKLEGILTRNHLLYTTEDYYEVYGYNDKEVSKAKYVIDEENKRIYENITNVLLEHLEKIKQTSIFDLVSSKFLRSKLEQCFDFFEDMLINDHLIHEIFYTAKYSYISTFFQNNYENFLPQADFQEIEKNDILTAFLEAVMIEFDKLDLILTESKKFKNYNEIPYDYITYLTQMLGLEPKNIMLLSDQKQQYRVLAENIIEIYSVKGSYKSFELLFNLLGYNAVLREYYFDRRLYFLDSTSNEETKQTNKEIFDFYLTEKDPRDNLLDGILTNEIVMDRDFSEKLNIRDFDDLVKKTSLEAVLGYSKTYTATDKKTYEYTGPVYKYFFTNYIKIEASFKYSEKNFNINNLYQLKTIVDFFIPKFKQKEVATVVNIETDDSDENIIYFLDKDHLNNDYEHSRNKFTFLDSETYTAEKEKYAKEYIANYSTDKINKASYNKETDEMSNVFLAVNNDGSKKPYYNSVGNGVFRINDNDNDDSVKEEGNYLAVFKPISERIRRINTTKYLGDAVGSNFIVHRVEEAEKPIKIETKEFTEITNEDAKKYDGLNKFKVEVKDTPLNGYENNSLRILIKNMNNKIKLNKVSESNIAEADTSEVEVLNYNWNKIKTIEAETGEETEEKIKEFCKNHNVLNYDYIQNQLYAKNETYIQCNGNSYKIMKNDGSEDTNSTNILMKLYSENSYFICKEGNNKYGVYRYEYVFEKEDYKEIKYLIKTATNKEINEASKQIKIDSEIGSDLNTIEKYIDKRKHKFKEIEKIEDEKVLVRELDLKGLLVNVGSGTQSYVINYSKTNKKIKSANSIANTANQITIKGKVVGENNSVGCFYLNSEDEKIKQFKVSASKKGLVYDEDNTFSDIDSCKSKVFQVLNDCWYEITDTIKYYFGIKPVFFEGAIKKENNEYYLYEHDEWYKGFSEKDDNDNFILNNYLRENVYPDWFDTDAIDRTARPIKHEIFEAFDDDNYYSYVVNDLLKSLRV